MVAKHMALDRLGRRSGRRVTQVTATIASADARVVAAKLADRLHNM
jgi:(p)ppGpp synthase/HD superfamily hydrolase